MDTFFSTDITDLPEATRPAVIELGDGDELELRLGPVAKRLGATTVLSCAYPTGPPRNLHTDTSPDGRDVATWT